MPCAGEHSGEHNIAPSCTACPATAGRLRASVTVDREINDPDRPAPGQNKPVTVNTASPSPSCKKTPGLSNITKRPFHLIRSLEVLYVNFYHCSCFTIEMILCHRKNITNCR
jgi:hypothetical protein